MDDLGDPIAYLVLEPGTPVYSSDGVQVATVRRVLADGASDIFDGLVLAGDGPDRFVDAPEVARIHERGVLLSLTAEQAAALPEHTAPPIVERIDPRSIGDGGTGAPARS